MSVIQTPPSPQWSATEIVQMERQPWHCPDCGCEVAWPMPCVACNEARPCDGEGELSAEAQAVMAIYKEVMESK